MSEIHYIPLKVCTRCKNLLKRTSFGADSRHRDGLQSQCRKCRRAADNKKRRAGGAKVRIRPYPLLLVLPDDAKPIPNHSEYAATPNGDIYSSRVSPDSPNGLWHKMHEHVSSSGYSTVHMKGDGGLLSVHRLILETLVGPCPPGMQCRHLNGIRTDNRLENLVWGTRSENAEDRRRHGTMTVGESSHHAVLTEDAIEAIRVLHGLGWSGYKLQRAFRISRAEISFIINKHCWKHVV